MATRALTHRDERGMSLIELMISLLVLAFGLLAVGRMFPAGARAQVQDRLLTGANYFAQEKLESLTGRTWADPLLMDGRHPAGTAGETPGGGQWARLFPVTTLTGKTANLKQGAGTGNHTGARPRPPALAGPPHVRAASPCDLHPGPL